MKNKIKNIFSTTKGKVIFAIAAVVITATAAGAIVTTAAVSKDTIGTDKAREIAFNRAGASENEVQRLRSHIDYNDGVKVYEIEFFFDGSEYDYEIDANSGAVRDYDIDKEFAVTTPAVKESTTIAATVPAPTEKKTEAAAPTEKTTANQTAAPTSKSPTTVNGNYIGTDKALDIVLAHAGLSKNNVTVIQNILDRDDGIFEYDIELISNKTKYEYEINALTGAIVSYDIEKYGSDVKTTLIPSDSGYIGSDKALETALNHAGFSANDITLIKNQFELDDGFASYEIEFYKGIRNYEYEINASTGAIVSFDNDIG